MYPDLFDWQTVPPRFHNLQPLAGCYDEGIPIARAIPRLLRACVEPADDLAADFSRTYPDHTAALAAVCRAHYITCLSLVLAIDLRRMPSDSPRVSHHYRVACYEAFDFLRARREVYRGLAEYTGEATPYNHLPALAELCDCQLALVAAWPPQHGPGAGDFGLKFDAIARSVWRVFSRMRRWGGLREYPERAGCLDSAVSARKALAKVAAWCRETAGGPVDAPQTGAQPEQGTDSTGSVPAKDFLVVCAALDRPGLPTSYKTLHRFLKDNGIRSGKPNPQRLQVDAADGVRAVVRHLATCDQAEAAIVDQSPVHQAEMAAEYARRAQNIREQRRSN
jgi:hypothetical protein